MSFATQIKVAERATQIANELVDRERDPVTWVGVRSLAAKLILLKLKYEHNPEWATEQEAHEERVRRVAESQ